MLCNTLTFSNCRSSFDTTYISIVRDCTMVCFLLYFTCGRGYQSTKPLTPTQIDMLYYEEKNQ